MRYPFILSYLMMGGLGKAFDPEAEGEMHKEQEAGYCAGQVGLLVGIWIPQAMPKVIHNICLLKFKSNRSVGSSCKVEQGKEKGYKGSRCAPAHL